MVALNIGDKPAVTLSFKQNVQNLHVLFPTIFNHCASPSLQYEAVVHPAAAAHVHHMILYSCNGLDSQLDQLTPEQLAGGPCSDGATASALNLCRGETIIAAWAVGGQVCSTVVS